MAYNQFLYNSALYNAGREEIGAIARSIIQAHTGPHIQAVVGSTSGVSFISDFVIQEGVVRKPPTSFKFPDLKAFLRVDLTGVDSLAAYIRGWAYKDLPAMVYPTFWLPQLSAAIYGLFESNLAAVIIGLLGQHDLPAIIQAAVADLPARVFVQSAPDLPAVINELLQPGQKMEPKLYACIHSPEDLIAYLNPVQKIDLVASIVNVQFAILSGQMLGIPTPYIMCFIRGVSSGTIDLPSNIRTSPVGAGILPAIINPVFTGETGYLIGLLAQIQSSGGFKDINSSIRILSPSYINLGALIKTAGDLDLAAIINMLGADNLSALVGAIPLGEKDKFLGAFLQSVIPYNLPAILTADANVAFLGATIEALRGMSDVSAFIRTAETFITTIFNVSTLAGCDLRATIGRPDCLGGSSIKNLIAFATAQHAKSLSAVVVSFIESNLGASINSPGTFHAFDTIDIYFSPRKVRFNEQFLAWDSIPISFSPFRGANLGASISAVLSNSDLSAVITTTFPLPSIVPVVNTITAVDLRKGRPQNLQEIRLRLEGQVREFFYVHGADKSFTKDDAEDWKINISSFKPIANSLFGDFASARICRLGSLMSFSTIDEAVRFCIQAVIGFSEDVDLSASIVALGGTLQLSAFLGITNNYRNIAARLLAGANDPILYANIEGSGSAPSPPLPVISAFTNLSAQIFYIPMADKDIGANINYPLGAQPPFAYPVNMSAYICPYAIATIQSAIQAAWSTYSLSFDGTEDEYVLGPSLEDLGADGQKLTVSFWLKEHAAPTSGEGILGSYSDYTDRNDGFGFRWVDSNTLEFFVNGTANRARADIIHDAQWYFVTGVYDSTLGSGNVKLYLNGVEGSITDDYQMPILGLSNPIILGRTSNFSSAEGGSITETHLNAYINSLGIWNDALSYTEINTLLNIHKRPWRPYYAPCSGYTSATDLVLCWTFGNAVNTWPIIESSSFTSSVFGTAVGLPVNNISNVVPSSNTVSMYLTNNKYWVSTDSDHQPLPNGYQGSFSFCWVGTFEFTNEASVVGMWKSGDTSGMPSFRVFRRWAGGADGKKLEVQIQDENGVESSVIGTSELEQSSTIWRVIVFSYDATNLSWVLYVDGALDSSGTIDAPREAPTEFTLAASRYNGSIQSNYRGKIDSLTVWSRPLLVGEISQLSNLSEELWLSTDSSLKINLNAWYRLGETGDTYDIIYDWSGNGPALSQVGSDPEIKRETPN